MGTYQGKIADGVVKSSHTIQAIMAACTTTSKIIGMGKHKILLMLRVAAGARRGLH
ncbi:MAG: hypothetical protein AB8I56_12150 [Anaerolineales bacterium]